MAKERFISLKFRRIDPKRNVSLVSFGRNLSDFAPDL
jgi:hypothetical protein